MLFCSSVNRESGGGSATINTNTNGNTNANAATIVGNLALISYGKNKNKNNNRAYGLIENTPCVPWSSITEQQKLHPNADSVCSTEQNSCDGGCCRAYWWLLCDDSGSVHQKLPCVCNANTRSHDSFGNDNNVVTDRVDNGGPREVRPGIIITPGPPIPATTIPITPAPTPLPTYRATAAPVTPSPTNAPTSSAPTFNSTDDLPEEASDLTLGGRNTELPLPSPVTRMPAPGPTSNTKEESTTTSSTTTPPAQDRNEPYVAPGLSLNPPSDTCAVPENNKYWDANEYPAFASAARCTTSHSCRVPQTCCLAEFCLCGYFRPPFKDQECVV